MKHISSSVRSPKWIGSAVGLEKVQVVRIMSPDHLRGRISAVSSIFIGSSNELGAFESGVAAKLLGTVRSVWLGGVITLLVVAATVVIAPRLRRLDLTIPHDGA